MGFEKHRELMEKLGKHSHAKSCLYIKRLSDIHIPTLKKLIKFEIGYLRSVLLVIKIAVTVDLGTQALDLFLNFCTHKLINSAIRR